MGQRFVRSSLESTLICESGQIKLSQYADKKKSLKELPLQAATLLHYVHRFPRNTTTLSPFYFASIDSRLAATTLPRYHR